VRGPNSRVKRERDTNRLEGLTGKLPIISLGYLEKHPLEEDIESTRFVG
jgi:hypothetical protein